MKKTLILVALFLTACSVKEEVVDIFKGADGLDGKDGISCMVQEVEAGALLSCSDESSVLITNGRDGRNGVDGQDGSDGMDGQDGADGQNGADGTLCSVQETQEGAVITCGDSIANLYNGTDGRDGADGQDGQDGQDGKDGEDGSDGQNASVLVTDYSGNSCTKITGTSYYVKKTGSNNFGIYTSSTCHSSSKQFEVSQGEAYPVATRVLGLWTTNSLRIYDFN